MALSRVVSFAPDLVILDVMMPGETGYEVAKKAKASPRSEGSTTPPQILMLTALSSIDALPEGMDAGADDFLSKPVNKLELITRVKSLLRVTLLRKRLADLLKDASDTPTA